MRDAIENQRHRHFLDHAVGGASGVRAAMARDRALLMARLIRLQIQLHYSPAE
jgi:hypothetical protein